MFSSLEINLGLIFTHLGRGKSIKIRATGQAMTESLVVLPGANPTTFEFTATMPAL
jgi:hypothetical protein